MMYQILNHPVLYQIKKFESVRPFGLRLSISVTFSLSNVTHDPTHFSQNCFPIDDSDVVNQCVSY